MNPEQPASSPADLLHAEAREVLRCLTGVTGSSWFVGRMRRHADLERYDALRATLLAYAEGMHSNEPVHTWEP